MELHACGGEERAVLDAVNAGVHAVGDASWTVGMGRHGEAVAVGLVHDGAQLDRSVLWFVRSKARRDHPAGGHDLHHVAASPGSLSHHSTQLLDVVRLTAQEPAMTPAPGEGRPGDKQLGAERGIDSTALTQREAEVAPVAEVTGRGDTGGFV